MNKGNSESSEEATDVNSIPEEVINEYENNVTDFGNDYLGISPLFHRSHAYF